MYFWEYKIKGWNQEVGEYTHTGLIYGENFTEAVDNLENWYGNEISSLSIECVGGKDEPYLLDKQYKIN